MNQTSLYLAMNRRVSEHKLRIKGEVDLLLNKFLPVKLANLTRRTNISLPYFQRTVSKIPVFYECRSCLFKAEPHLESQQPIFFPRNDGSTSLLDRLVSSSYCSHAIKFFSVSCSSQSISCLLLSTATVSAL